MHGIARAGHRTRRLVAAPTPRRHRPASHPLPRTVFRAGRRRQEDQGHAEPPRASDELWGRDPVANATESYRAVKGPTAHAIADHQDGGVTLTTSASAEGPAIQMRVWPANGPYL